MHDRPTVAFWKRRLYEYLKKNGIEAPERTAWDLLVHATGLSRARLMTSPEQPLSARQISLLEKYLLARSKHTPIQYILGTEDFWGMSLAVGKGVLIPRPETELLIEVVKKRFQPDRATPRMVDLCTGSGNIALALCREYPHALIKAVDKSKRALAWAMRNQKRTGCHKVRFVLGDMATVFEKKQQRRISLVTSNPPYIPSCDMCGLQAEVLREPRMALHGGPDGLKYIRQVVSIARALLHPGGLCVCEIGIGQGEQTVDCFKTHEFSDVQIQKDWQGISRIISGIRI